MRVRTNDVVVVPGKNKGMPLIFIEIILILFFVFMLCLKANFA